MMTERGCIGKGRSPVVKGLYIKGIEEVIVHAMIEW
jgi:hypothetical protein